MKSTEAEIISIIDAGYRVALPILEKRFGIKGNVENY